VVLATAAFALVAVAGANGNLKTDTYPSKPEGKSPAAKLDTTRPADPVAVPDAARAASH